MPLIKDGEVIEDRFARIGDDEALPTDGTPALVSLARWNAERSALEGHNGELGLLLTTADSVRTIDGDLSQFSMIAIEVPTFKDGRVFSSARLLRERFGYDGEVRAFGHVLPDQALYLARCGVSEIGFEDEVRLGAFKDAFRELTVAFQPSRATTIPPLRERLSAEYAQAAE